MNLRKVEFTPRFRSATALGLVVLMLLASCQSVQPGASAAPGAAGGPQPGGKVTWAWNADLKSLAPYQGAFTIEGAIVQHIFESLVAYNTVDRKFVPMLAESWEVSADGKVWTFKLRKDVKFHDGTPMNAQAVKATFDQILDPKAKASPFTIGYFGGYDNAQVVDDYTFRVNFKTANGRFIDGLAAIKIMSPAAIAKYGEDIGRNPIGTGPFIFKEWVSGDHVTLVKDPNYKRGYPGYSHEGPPYIDELTFRVIPDDVTRAAALEKGEIQFAFLGFADYARFASDSRFQALKFVRPGTVRALQFNTERETVADVAVRQGISYAIDSAAIAKAPIFGGAAVQAKTPLSPTMFGYDQKLEQLVPTYDPAKARQILDTAGWKVGPTGIREKDGKRLAVKFRTVRLTLLDQVALLVQAQLQAIGVGVDLQLSPDWNALLPIVKQGDYDMMIGGSFQADLGVLEVNYDPAQIGTSFVIFSRYPDKNLEQLLRQGAQTTDPQQRFDIYSKVQQILMQQYVLTPMYAEPFVFGAAANLKGLRTDQSALPRFHDAYLQK